MSQFIESIASLEPWQGIVVFLIIDFLIFSIIGIITDVVETFRNIGKEKKKEPKPIPVGKRAPMFHKGMEVMIKPDVFRYAMLGHKDMEFCKDFVFRISAKFESDDAGIWYEIQYNHFDADGCVGEMWNFMVPESYLMHPPKDRADPRTLIYVVSGE